jgi:hypothetical protein
MKPEFPGQRGPTSGASSKSRKTLPSGGPTMGSGRKQCPGSNRRRMNLQWQVTCVRQRRGVGPNCRSPAVVAEAPMGRLTLWCDWYSWTKRIEDTYDPIACLLVGCGFRQGDKARPRSCHIVGRQL